MRKESPPDASKSPENTLGGMRNAFTNSNPVFKETEKEQGIDSLFDRRKSSLFYDLGQQEVDNNDDSQDLQ